MSSSLSAAKFLTKHPMIIATLQATGLAAISNILAQLIEVYRGQRVLQGLHTFSFADFLRFVILNLIIAPPNYYWQVWLEEMFPAYTKEPESQNETDEIELERLDDEEAGGQSDKEDWRKGRLNLKNTAMKLLLDCATAGALVNTVAFLLLMGIMKGMNLGQIGATIQHETVPLMIASYQFWPIASVIMFCYAPPEKRIVWGSAFGLCWGVYLSFVGSRL